MPRQSVRQSNDDAASSNSRVLRERRRQPKPVETGVYSHKPVQRRAGDELVPLIRLLGIDRADDPAIPDVDKSPYGSVMSDLLPKELLEENLTPSPVERMFELLRDQWLVRCGELAQEGNVVGEKQMVLLAAVLYVGRLAERLDVRKAEHLAAAGRASRRGSRIAATNANAKVRKDNEERNAAWQQQINELVMKKGLSYAQAKKRVATEAGVSDETVDRGTKNPRPRNGGRHAKKPAR